jgi:hypothetical protein
MITHGIRPLVINAKCVILNVTDSNHHTFPAYKQNVINANTQMNFIL